MCAFLLYEELLLVSGVKASKITFQLIMQC